jgi:integrase
MRQPARVLASADVRHMLLHVEATRHPLRNRTLILLSVKAGLRAGEMAQLDWSMVLKPNGRLNDQLRIHRSIAKYGSGRQLPIAPALAEALRELHREQSRPLSGPVIQSERGGAMTARSIVNWFRGIYDELGLRGCSSHSGRRTFITRTARLLARTGGSLRDVQELAGHRSLKTTEGYIEGDRDVQRRLVNLI